MKEDVEDLIRIYKKRIKSLEEMATSANSDIAKLRLNSKKNVYKTVVTDLEKLIRDEQDET